MSYLWKIVRPLMFVVGGILIFGAIGTSDYYVLQLGQAEPATVWSTITIGFALMVPTLLHMICGDLKGRMQ
jgi:hypothetical protein